MNTHIGVNCTVSQRSEIILTDLSRDHYMLGNYVWSVIRETDENINNIKILHL